MQVLVEASRVPEEGEEEVLLMRQGWTAEEALREGCKKGATVDRRSGRCRYRDRLMSLQQHLAWTALRRRASSGT